MQIELLAYHSINRLLVQYNIEVKEGFLICEQYA